VKENPWFKVRVRRVRLLKQFEAVKRSSQTKLALPSSRIWASASFILRGCKIHFKIEAVWDGTFGDCKAEIVFIGQNLDEAQIRQDLSACQIAANQPPEDWKTGRPNAWPVERASPL